MYQPAKLCMWVNFKLLCCLGFILSADSHRLFFLSLQNILKVKGICLEHRYPCDYTCQNLPPLVVGTQQPATILIQTLALCTRYPVRLGGPRQCGIWSLPDISTHGQHEPQTFWSWGQRPIHLATCSPNSLHIMIVSMNQIVAVNKLIKMKAVWSANNECYHSQVLTLSAQSEWQQLSAVSNYYFLLLYN